jgi:exopolysaccharide biosynthesis polyprenyl glycosylphosphotransferase
VPILLVWGVAFHAFDLYRPQRLGSHLSEWIDVAKASTLGVLVLVAIMSLVFRSYDYSRVVIGLFWIASIVAVSFSRAVFREALRFARRRGYNQRHAVVVGQGEPASEVLRMLRRRPDLGIRVVGVLSDKHEARDGSERWLGGLEDIRTVLTTRAIDLVFIALPHEDYPRLTSVLNEIGDEPVAIHLVPDVFGLTSLRGGVEEFEAIPFIHLRESPLYGWSRVLKRAMDLGLGSLALVVGAPVMLLIAAALAATTGRPVLYRQERMGLDGRRFSMLKFRTMHRDAEVATGPVWAVANDPRRTSFGAVLRRWNLDELPQLFHVLRGDMSLVGPRPERPSFVEAFRQRVPGYMLRHKMKAGITGWAQVNGWRGDTSIEKRIEYDLYYIERWSLAFDLKILLLTLWNGFRGRNAY